MPDPTHYHARKKRFELARTMRIQELAKQWGVPTQNIYTTVNWGPDQTVDVPNTATYYTFDRTGNVYNQKIDYGPVLGYPAGVYSPAPSLGHTPTATADSIGRSGALSEALLQKGGSKSTSMKKGGRLKKAQDGDILPVRRPFGVSSALENVPITPLQTADPMIKTFFEQQRAGGMVPNDASLNGPDPYSPQYLLDAASGEVIEDPDYTPVQSQAATFKRAGAGFGMDINAGAMITGLNTAINNLYDRSRGLKEFNRLKRKQLQGPGYNPYQYGTGSQAIYKHGGTVRPISSNQYSAPVLQFNGPSHAEGGIPISYGGKKVEVEGAETAYMDQGGDLNIFGDLTVPGTNMKFKTAAGKLAIAEAKAARKMDKGQQLIAAADPTDRFERLQANSGRLKVKSAAADQQALTMLKERLSLLQEGVLTDQREKTAAKAKHGLAIAQDGKKVPKPSMAARHNNPGNIKYAPWEKKYGAVKGEKSSDGGYFARFPSTEQGLRAMKALLRSPAYSGQKVEDAILKWTGGSGYNIPLNELQGKTVKSLSEDQLKGLMDVITRGEDSRLYDLDFLFTPGPKDPAIDTSINPPASSLKPVPGGPVTYTNNPPGTTPPSGRTPAPALDIPPLRVTDQPQAPYRNPLRFSQIAPELLTLGERPDFVPGQRYEPNLYQPYQVSFQDRLNENQATFNRVALQAGNNPAALSVLAGQKYMADSGVLADEFRTNQGITNDVTNKNIALLNEAQLKNLQLADTQFVRQEQAKANTRTNINNAISSIASKIDQNRLETRAYNAASSLFPQYTFDRQGTLQYIPNEDQYFAPPATMEDSAGYYQRMREEYNGAGALHKTVINTPSQAEQNRLRRTEQDKALRRNWLFGRRF